MKYAIKHCDMKAYGGSGGIAPPFLSSALDWGEWSASCPGRFTPGKIAPGTHWIGGWVGPITGLDSVDKKEILPLPEIANRPYSRRYTDWASH
jgi:hypothetical protein